MKSKAVIIAAGFECDGGSSVWNYVKVYINIEQLTKEKATYNQVQSVISHELGHALGLRHQMNPTSKTIMKPFYDTFTWYYLELPMTKVTGF